jgi:nitrite reductase (NADH) large subunit
VRKRKLKQDIWNIEHMKILIIGNSAASTAAIEAIRKYDKKSSIVQFSDETYPLYSRCLASYHISGKVNDRTILYRHAGFHKEMNVDLHAGIRVAEVDPKNQQIMCENRETYDYEKLLISTGSSPKIPDNIKKDIKGIFQLRTIENALAIKSYLSNVKNAVIVGGGLIGMRIAEALSICGLKVTVIIRSNRVLSQMIDLQAARIIRKALEANNIEVLTQTDITEIVSKNKRIAAVKTDQGQIINCELLVVAKGVSANTGLIASTDIKKQWGIITDENMRTNYKNVFAAGDVAETYDIVTEQHTVNALWTCAVQQGFITGYNIAGRPKAYNGSLGMNSLNFFKTSLISYGINSPKDESEYKILVDMKPDQNIYKKIVIKDNRIKGIILVGKIGNAGLLLSLLQNQSDISSFKDELLSDFFNYGTLLKYMGRSELKKYYDA